MGTVIIDKTGEADLSFHSVPLHAVKKATFKTKLGVLHDLLKMVWNGFTYHFAETAQNGAVIFNSNYKNWEFIAPDDRLDFAGYADMTIGEVLTEMETVLTASPIPAWDRFAVWLDDNSLKAMLGNVTETQLITPSGVFTKVNNLEMTDMTSFVDLLEILRSCLAPALEQSMADYASGKGYACQLWINSSITMKFTFRE